MTKETPKMTIAPRLRDRQRGFSLIELLLVLVILSILAAVIVPRFTNRAQQAKETAAATDISALQTALRMFEVDNGRYPTSEEGLIALKVAPAGLDKWRGYLERTVPKDPWGRPYVYRCPGQHNEDGFDLMSLGPDGQEGTDDDVVNWEIEN